MIAYRKVFAFRKPAWPNLLTAATVLLFSTAEINAEPYIAMRTGFKCSQCHVNRIGGGERTEYGSVYSQYKLLMTQTEDLMQAQQGGQSSFNPRINDAITLGANFRVENVTTGTYSYTDTNFTTSTVGGKNQANIKEANLYINVELVKNFLSLYMDDAIEGKSVGAREMFGMVRNLPLNGYVKVGKTLLPYGIRLVDDDAFIRSKTGYTYDTRGIAAEIGLEPGPLSLTANLTNDQFSSVGSVVYRHFRVGGSYGSSTKISNQYTYGPFAGVNYGRVTLMGEVDLIRNPDKRQMADFLELDFLPVQGCNVKGTYEYFDRDRDVSNTRDGQQRWTFGVEPFVARFLQLGLFYRINQFVPQDVSDNNQNMVITRAQVFF